MKKMTYFVMAMALVLGFTQCKKEQSVELNQNESVRITLTVDGGASTGSAAGGSRVIVDPTGNNGEFNYATVDFEEGDSIFVGYNNAYVGVLKYQGGSFSGNVNISTIVSNEHLHFYFLGGKGFRPSFTESGELSVNISSQAVKFPVISYAPSNEEYIGVASYSAKLMNKCSIMKFNVTKPAESVSAICITGMNNKVTVNFNPNTPDTDDGFTYLKDGNGQIMMKGGAGASIETWGVVLPQTTVAAGEAYTADEAYTGTRPAIEGGIASNVFYNQGISITLEAAAPSHEYVDLGLPSGTLWATCNVGADTPEGYGDYFAWGETTKKNTFTWSTYQYCNGSYNTLTKYCNNSSYGYNNFSDDLTTLLPEDDAATANWGSDWRMPTQAEWQELYNNTTVELKQQNGVDGLLFTANNGSGNSLFLPAAGFHNDNGFNSGGNSGYWSSSLYTDNPSDAGQLFFLYPYYSQMSYGYRYYGFSVRGVRAASKN